MKPGPDASAFYIESVTAGDWLSSTQVGGASIHEVGCPGWW